MLNMLWPAQLPASENNRQAMNTVSNKQRLASHRLPMPALPEKKEESLLPAQLNNSMITTTASTCKQHLLQAQA
jgi:hypothetical protein